MIRQKSHGLVVFLCVAALFLSCVSWAQSAPQFSVQQLRKAFVSPPDDARIMMRWWWFGPAVTHAELEREIRQMKDGGIGGFEIQPVYPQELDDASKDFRNLPYLSDGFLDAVRFANHKGRELGMRVDITLGSGWPYGGSYVPVTQASSRLRLVKTALQAGADSVALPHVANGESLVAAFLASGSPDRYDAARAEQVALPQAGYRLQVKPDPAQSRVVLFFLSSRTGQMVKRPAVDADGFVMDHMDKAAVENHLHAVADRLIQAFGDEPPYAVFSDSLEVYGADWTGDFLDQFRARRGYDLRPHLPALFADAGPDTASIRHDWGQTLTELVNERYLKPITAWAAQHKTRFRSQTYGFPPVTLSSNNLVDLAEGEGMHWRSFSTTRWASSANHVYGRDITSAETFTWLHSPSFRATPLDMKAEADRMFLEGVNQIVGHGWPYSPAVAGEPGWALYAAGVFNAHNPWWPAMPEIARYMQRVSFLMRQGEPANDVAVFLPTDDAWAGITPGKASVSEQMKRMMPALTAPILDAGFNFDYIDSEAVEARGIRYPVLILPRVDRISLAAYQKIEEYVKQGGKVIALGSTPAHAPGLLESKQVSPQIAQISERLFRAPSAPGRVAESEAALGALLKASCKPDMQLETPSPQIGFAHRRLPGADVYFVANTGNVPVRTAATFRSSHKQAEWWDAIAGSTAPVSRKIELALAPYESRVLVFHDGPVAAPAKLRTEERVLADLSHDWKVTFPGIKYSVQMPSLKSWTEDAATKFYSGEAVYEKDFALPAVSSGASVFLDFGEGTVVPEVPLRDGMRAFLESPIREAAVVIVNGKQAGYVWCPPYRVNITALLHPGSNHVEIRVGNLAINTLAGRDLPDYRLLNTRYGERFKPQNMEHLEPLPSGITGPVMIKVAGGKK